MTYADEINKFARRIKILHNLETEGITCRDCKHYPCSENKATMPLCVAFERKELK